MGMGKHGCNDQKATRSPVGRAGLFFLSCTSLFAFGCAHSALDANSPEIAPSAESSKVVEVQAESVSTPATDEATAPSADEAPAQVSVEDERTPEGHPPFPELHLRPIGMHIGGDPNTARTKAPWNADLENALAGLPRCAVYLNRPGNVGSVGVDLRVPQSGKGAEVTDVRQKLGGPDFESCIREELSAVEYHPRKTPTVLSWSFVLEWIEG